MIDRDPHIIANSTGDIGEAIACLTREQVEALAPYLHDHATQQEIADATGIHRRTISYRIGQGVRQLAKQGIDIAMPGRGRRPARTVIVETRAMDRLTTEDDGEMLHGRWVSEPKGDSDNAQDKD